jgi:predicted enzyme related to lactoylglutathione lyase
MQRLGTLRQLIVPVASVEDALPFYRDALGLDVRFQDGDRWAALEAGGLTLALAGPGEHPAGDRVALGVKVVDLDDAIARIEAAGGTVLEPPREGAHERRAACLDGHGTPIALYEPLRAAG